MAGILLVSGQTWIVDQMKTTIDGLGGLYIGLMTDSATPSEEAQVGAGITEINPVAPTGSGYNRILCDTWTVVSGVDPVLSGESVMFYASGVWENVRGYFVALGAVSGVADALWAEPFPLEKQGNKVDRQRIYINPIYEQHYCGE